MLEQQHNLCEKLIDYLAGDCTEAERESFERHLYDCSACKQELEELKEVWLSMPGHSEDFEVPSDLKAQVMERIFHGEGNGREEREALGLSSGSPSYEGMGRQGSGRRRRFFTNRRAWTFTAAAVLLGLAVGIAAWRGVPFPSAKVATLAEPAQVVRTIALKPADPSMPDCSGTVWVTKRAESEEMVVHLQGLRPTQGSEAYQVWLIHKGVRTNGGTLVVDGKGSGVLTYTVRKEDPAFEAIGVTLEPDAQGSQPRGRKVLGS